MKRILLATDFSESCLNALKFIKGVIQGTDIKVDLAHVYFINGNTLASISPASVDGLLKETKSSLLKELQELQAQLPKPNRGDLHAVYGVYPSSDIVDIAVQHNSDLIVMALRQKYSLIDRLIGTITAQTILKSPVPVLAIPNGAQFNGIKEILFPTDFHHNQERSDAERKALMWMQGLSQLLGKPKMRMVHVSDDHGNNVDVSYEDKNVPNLSFLVTHAPQVDEGILATMTKFNIDLLAFYKPNRKFWERLYHSSITRKLLFKSRTPLLVFS